MEKRPFNKQTKILNLDKDLGLGQDINIEVWKDPSKNVSWGLLVFYGLSESGRLSELNEEDRDRINEEYYYNASAVLIDCDIEGVDFSTPEATKQVFEEDDRFPWGIFHIALMVYVAQLTQEYAVLKNVLRRVKELSNSGENNENKEAES